LRRRRPAPALDIGSFEIVDSQHSHGSAAKAVELVKAGRAEALMKGRPFTPTS